MDNSVKFAVETLIVKLGCVVLGMDPEAAPQADRLNEEDRTKFALVDLVAADPETLKELINRNRPPDGIEKMKPEEREAAMKPIQQRMRQEVIDAAAKLGVSSLKIIEEMKASGELSEERKQIYYSSTTNEKNPNLN